MCKKLSKGINIITPWSCTYTFTFVHRNLECLTKFQCHILEGHQCSIRCVRDTHCKSLHAKLSTLCRNITVASIRSGSAADSKKHDLVELNSLHKKIDFKNITKENRYRVGVIT